MNKHIVNKNISAVAFICLSAHAMDVNDQEDPSRKRDRPVSAETTDELPHKKLKGDGKDSEEEASALFKTPSISDVPLSPQETVEFQNSLKAIPATGDFATSTTDSGFKHFSSSVAPGITEETNKSSVFFNAPRILVCNEVYASSRNKWSIEKQVHIPTYQTELSQWVLQRRLNQLHQGIDVNSFLDSLKECFSYSDIWLSTTSNARFENQGYQFVVNHVGCNTSWQYYCVFDVFLKDAPLDLWLEGVMSVSDIQFEGIGVRDAYDLTYSYEILKNNRFPEGNLADLLSGKKIPKTEQSEGMKNLIKNVLHEDVLNSGIFWEMRFIPFINSVKKK